MKNTRILSILALCVPLLTIGSLGASDCNKKEKCPITQTVCPPFCEDNGAVVNINTDDPVNPQPGSLRQAILDANDSNATPCNPFVIEFELLPLDNIITPVSPLPAITKPVCINGFSNTDASETKRIINVEIHDQGLTLTETACGSTIKGLRFVGAGFQAVLVQADNSRIYGNDISGKNNPNDFDFENLGIVVDGAKNVTIGGLCPSERNVIEFTILAVLILSDNVTVVGNYIGPNANGSRSLFSDSSSDGLLGNILGIVAIGNNLTIGCKKKCGGNIISSNVVNAILVGSCINFTCNIVGLDAWGKKGLFNVLGVILIGPHNKISKSVISSNLLNNLVLIGSFFSTVQESLLGTNICGNQGFPTLNNVAALFSSQNCIKKNLISAQTDAGLSLLSSSSNSVIDNTIGSDCKHSFAIGQQVGVEVGLSLLDLVLPTQAIATRQSVTEISITQAALADKLLQVEPTIQQYPVVAIRYQESLLELQRVSPVFNGLEIDQESEMASFSHKKPKPRATRSCQPCSPTLGFVNSVPELFEPAGNRIVKNEILGNLRAGILTEGARNTFIKDNFIGTSSKGCVVPNGYGALLKDGSQCNSIECNFIAGNLFNGIAVQGVEITLLFSQTFKNSILKNAIFNNCRNGIKLSINGNSCLAAPRILSAKKLLLQDKVEVEIDGDSLPNTPFLLELYGNFTCKNGITEGQVFLCCFTIKESVGDIIKLIAPLRCPELKFVSATVTELDDCLVPGSTSEFACPVRIEKLLDPEEAEENRAEKTEAPS